MIDPLKKQISDYLYSGESNLTSKEILNNGLVVTIHKEITDKVVSCLQNDQVIPQILADTYNSIEKYRAQKIEDAYTRMMMDIVKIFDSDQEISTQQLNSYIKVREMYDLIGEPNAA